MTDPVLIVGGYGVVGLQIAQLIRKRNPDLEIILAGRSIEKARVAAAELGNAQAVYLDISTDQPLEHISTPVGAVIAVVNDPANALMRDAINRKIPYVDVTRWTERLKEAQEIATKSQPESSVTLSSSWMAGISAMIAVKACDGLSSIDEIKTSVLFRLKDKAGPNSVEYADRLSIPFRIRENGKWRSVSPLTSPMEVGFPSGETATAYLFDEPSQETLVTITGANSVSSRIAYDDPGTTRFMAILVKYGIWKLISGSFCERFRRSLIYNPGEGASHEIVITVSGTSEDGVSKLSSATILAPEGQTHLTAIGAYIQLCTAIGLEDQSPREPGVHFPEKGTDLGFALTVMKEEGVNVQFS